MPATARYRFASFEVCPQERRIWKHGTKLKLHGQPLQILLMLLERPGEVLTREDIRKRLWPKETFVDFEHSVNTAIKKLRQILGDSAQAPRFVETLPGVGYRFVAKVEWPLESAGVPETVPATGISLAKPRAHTQLWYRAVGLTVATTFALFILAYYFFYPLPVPRGIQVTEITHSGKVDAWGGLVFDGARLLFLERAGDHWNLMQTSATGGPAVTVNAPFQNTRILDISPDNSQLLIASFVERDASLPIWIMPLQGGPPRRLGNVVTGSASWTPSGKQIVYASNRDLMIVDEDGSNAHTLVSVPGYPSLPAWSPDGHTMRFTVNVIPGGKSELWEATADGKNAHSVFKDPAEFEMTCCGRWTPDGRYFIFTAKRGRIPELWAHQEKSPFWRRRLSNPVELTASPDEIWYPVVSRDSKTVFAFSFRPSEETARISLSSGKASPVLPVNGVHAPNFSADGKWVSYVLDSPRTIWRSDADGRASLQLTAESLNAFEPHWSPDGRTIAFVSEHPGKPWKAFLISADGGTPQQILPQFDFSGRADWSPDGKILVMEARRNPVPQSLEQGSGASLYLLDLATGQAEEMPDTHGFQGPRWSPDGKRIAATNDPNDAVMIYDVKTRRWTSAATGTYLSAVAWSKDSRYLYYQDVLGKDEPLYRIGMRNLKRETVFNFHELLSGNVFRCGFVGLDPSGAPIVTLSLSDSNIYAIDLDLP